MMKKGFSVVSAITLLGFGIVVAAPVAFADGRWGRHHHFERHEHYYWREAELPSVATIVYVGEVPYYYCDGAFYRRGPRGYVIVPAPIGAVVTALPTGCQTVVIDGVVYQVYDGVYYRSVPGGYVAVPSYQVQTVQPVGTVSKFCPTCGRTYSGSEKYCQFDGTALKIKGMPAQSIPQSQAQVAQPVATAPTNLLPSAAPQTFVVNVPNKNGSYTPVTLQAASDGTYIGPQGEVYPTKPTEEQLKELYGKK